MNPTGDRDVQDENLHQEQPTPGQQPQQEEQQKQAMTEVQEEAADEREQEGGYQ